MQFYVEGNYVVPEWWDVTVDAESEEEARVEAIKYIQMSYPEALDIEIEGVQHLG